MKSITYQCIECNNLRRLTLPENHSDHLMLTHNGLNIYSDFHKCDLGLLGVNNIHVDENLNVRTIEPLQLPKEKKVQTSNNFIPKPTLSQQYTTLNIASVANVSNFRFVMIDSSLKIILNV